MGKCAAPWCKKRTSRTNPTHTLRRGKTTVRILENTLGRLWLHLCDQTQLRQWLQTALGQNLVVCHSHFPKGTFKKVNNWVVAVPLEHMRCYTQTEETLVREKEAMECEMQQLRDAAQQHVPVSHAVCAPNVTQVAPAVQQPVEADATNEVGNVVLDKPDENNFDTELQSQTSLHEHASLVDKSNNHTSSEHVLQHNRSGSPHTQVTGGHTVDHETIQSVVQDEELAKLDRAAASPPSVHNESSHASHVRDDAHVQTMRPHFQEIDGNTVGDERIQSAGGNEDIEAPNKAGQTALQADLTTDQPSAVPGDRPQDDAREKQATMSTQTKSQHSGRDRPLNAPVCRLRAQLVAGLKLDTAENQWTSQNIAAWAATVVPVILADTTRLPTFSTVRPQPSTRASSLFNYTPLKRGAPVQSPPSLTASDDCVDDLPMGAHAYNLQWLAPTSNTCRRRLRFSPPAKLTRAGQDRPPAPPVTTDGVQRPAHVRPSNPAAQSTANTVPPQQTLGELSRPKATTRAEKLVAITQQQNQQTAEQQTKADTYRRPSQLLY